MTNDTALTAQLIEIENILGIRHLRIEPGKVTILRGRNGAGKTSALESLRWIVGGGTDATILATGAESGRAVIVLNNGVEVSKRAKIGAKDALTVRVPDSGKISTPQQYLDRIHSALRANPIAFLDATDKDRADILASTLNLAIPIAAVEEIIGRKIDAPPLMGLEWLQSIRKAVYDARTESNGIRRRARDRVDELGKSAPATSDRYNPAALDAAKKMRITLERQYHETLAAAAATESRARETAQAAFESEKGVARAAYDTTIAIAQARLTDSLAAMSQTKDAATAHARESFGAQIEAAVAAVAKMEAAGKEAGRINNIRAMIANAAAEDADATAASLRADAQLAALDSLKERTLAALPISGLTIEDGKIYRDGVSFDRLNHGQQIEIAIQVATHAAGDLKLVCVDRLESLDTTRFAAFVAAAMQTDLQWIVSRVSDDESITVETIGE